jgi:hypothetical protein
MDKDDSVHGYNMAQEGSATVVVHGISPRQGREVQGMGSGGG